MVQSIEKTDDDSALKVLIELAESSPRFLRPQLETIFEVGIKVCEVIGFCHISPHYVTMLETISVQISRHF